MTAPESDRRTFLPKPQSPIDPRVPGVVLAVLGLVGTIAAFAMSDEPGVIRGGLGYTLVIVSVLGGIVGLFLTVPAVQRYGWNARPPRGWPKLTVSDKEIEYSAGPDEVSRIPWDRVRKVVRQMLEYYGQTTPRGVTIHYLTQRGGVKQLEIWLADWAEPDEVFEALTGRETSEDESE